VSHGFLAAVGWWLAGFENTRQGSGFVHCEFWKFYRFLKKMLKSVFNE
jgi:hypothetical protein